MFARRLSCSRDFPSSSNVSTLFLSRSLLVTLSPSRTSSHSTFAFNIFFAFSPLVLYTLGQKNKKKIIIRFVKRHTVKKLPWRYTACLPSATEVFWHSGALQIGLLLLLLLPSCCAGWIWELQRMFAALAINLYRPYFSALEEQRTVTVTAAFVVRLLH